MNGVLRFRVAHLSFLQSLISTGLQPGVERGSGQSRFNGLADAPNDSGTRKRLKPFLSFRPLITRLKPGANERRNFSPQETEMRPISHAPQIEPCNCRGVKI
jgi:hypothetical protein